MILHWEKTNKVFWKALSIRLLLTFTTGHLPSKSGGATSRRIRRQLRRAIPPPLIDDFDVDLVPSSPPSASPTTTATVGRYNPRDLILSFILSNMLICHANMLYILDLVHLFYMIYILVLIWKLHNYLTIPAWSFLTYLPRRCSWGFDRRTSVKSAAVLLVGLPFWTSLRMLGRVRPWTR
jgi:hypothetical protein